MARPPNAQPTEAELRILQVLWERGPIPLGELCEGLREERELATTTVATTLRKMEEKGLVRRSGARRGALWRAARSREETSRGLVGRLLDHVFGGSASRLVTHLLEDGELSDDERAAILERLAEHEGSTPDADDEEPTP